MRPVSNQLWGTGFALFGAVLVAWIARMWLSWAVHDFTENISVGLVLFLGTISMTTGVSLITRLGQKN